MSTRFIVLEGVDGSGKTHIGQMLAESLEYVFTELNQDELRDALAMMRRHVDQAALHLMNLTSLKHTSTQIERILAAGGGVVCARYSDTVEIYNTEVNRDRGKPIIEPNLDDLHLAQPDAKIFLHVNEEERQRRMQERGKQKASDFLMEIPDLRKRIIQGYRNSGADEVDTSNLTPSEIVEQIYLTLNLERNEYGL